MVEAYEINKLARNRRVFEALLSNTAPEAAQWKPATGQWSLLEVICHLRDEEREDFRARVRHCLENPELPLPQIDPSGWVLERKYLEQDFEKRLVSFLKERDDSIKWLGSQTNPNWKNTREHPTLGKISADRFLSNWLAHDYIHIRQINRIRYEYLDSLTQDSLDYAGEW